MIRARTSGWWATALVVTILAMALLHRQASHPSEPARRDPRQAEAWMVDALPGIGPKRLTPVLADIRAGKIGQVPKPARAVAELVFEP
jgi:hypothetical protein